MAVELYVLLRHAVPLDLLVPRAELILHELLGTSSPPLTITTWEGSFHYPPVLSPKQLDCVYVHCTSKAKVEIGVFDGYNDDQVVVEQWVCISFAPMRTPQSKTLCVALAIALGEIQEAPIYDEADMLGFGRIIDSGKLRVEWRDWLQTNPIAFAD